MNKHHGHGQGHSHSPSHHGKSGHSNKRVHKDWRTWVVVGLMLLGMAVYVLTLDEAVQPVEVPESSPTEPLDE